MNDLPIACTLSEEALRIRRGSLARLGAQSTSITKIENELRLELPADTLMTIVSIVDAERQCCRFLRFILTIESNLGPISLEVTGPDGTQGFLESLFDRA